MRAALLIAAIGFAGCAVRLAGAADIRQIDCPTARLSDQERAAFVQGVRERAPRTDARFEAFLARLDDCARSHGWSPEVVQQAGLYNLSVVGQAEMRRRLEDFGVDVAPIERALLADTALVAALGSDRHIQEQMAAFVSRLDPSVDELAARQPAGTDVETPLGMYIAYRAIMESARARFAAN